MNEHTQPNLSGTARLEAAGVEPEPSIGGLLARIQALEKMIHSSCINFNGQDNDVIMIGFNARPDGLPIDPKEVVWVGQLEHHYKSGERHWLEASLNVITAAMAQAPIGDRFRVFMIKTDRVRPFEFMDIYFTISGPGAGFHITSPSDVEHTGKTEYFGVYEDRTVVDKAMIRESHLNEAHAHELSISGHLTFLAGGFICLRDGDFLYSATPPGSTVPQVATIGSVKCVTTISPNGQPTMVKGPLQAKEYRASDGRPGLTCEMVLQGVDGPIKCVYQNGLLVDKQNIQT